MRGTPASVMAAALVLAAGLLGGCAAEPPAASPAPGSGSAAERPTRAPGQPTVPAETIREGDPEPSDGRPAASRLSVPALGLTDLPVVPYRGRTDDARGTRIQNDGSLASPHGPRGGTGPGGLGNYQVTGHRLSSTMPFRHLPGLRRGERVLVESGGGRYVYRIVDTRRTSFRSPRSLRQQRAAVPGRPGATPTRAMITLSTCATIEDHAAGNFWSDRFDNPEHRIDKVGVLVGSRPARRAAPARG